MCPAQGHNAVTQVRLESGASLSQVKHSTNEQLRSQANIIDRSESTPFPKEASKSCQRMIKQTKFVVIGAFRVNFIKTSMFII